MDQEIYDDEPKNNEINLQNFIDRWNEYGQKIDLNGKEEKTAAVLFGKTRVGKSTIFHILKGDELLKNKKDLLEVDLNKVTENHIGEGWESFTKSPNIFNLNTEIDIIDTAGFRDNQDKLDDLIQQILLLQILESYKNILIIIVVEFNKNNVEFLKEPLKLVQDYFTNKEELNFMLQNSGIFLIVNQITDSQFEFFNQNLKKEIDKQDGKDKYNISPEFLSYIQKSLCIMKPSAEKRQQKELQEQVYNFIKKKRIQNERIKFKLSITDEGITTIQNIIIDVLGVFQKELSNSIQKFIEQIENQDNLEEKRDKLMYFLQLLQDNIFLQYFDGFYYQGLTKYFKNQECENCLSEELEKYKFLFQQKLIENLIQNLMETFNNLQKYEIIITDNKQRIWKKVKIIQEQIMQQINPDNQSRVIQNAIEKSFKTFQQYNNWNKLLVFFGNPLCGKSTSINLLYNCKHRQMHFDNLLMMIHFDQFQNDKLVTFAQYEQDLIIEFQQFSDVYVVLLQYFFAYCNQNNKIFSLQIVSDGNFLNQEIQLGLKKFLNYNVIQNIPLLKIIFNPKCESEQPQNIDLNILSSIIRNLEYQKIQTLNQEFQQGIQTWNNTECFNRPPSQKKGDKILDISKFLNDRVDYISQQFIQSLINILYRNKYFKNTIQDDEINLLIKLFRLNPSKKQFSEQLQNFFNYLNIQPQLNQNNNNGNHHQLKLLVYTLIERRSLINIAKKVSKECYLKFQEIEKIIQKYPIRKAFNYLDKIKLLIDSLNIHEDLLKNNEKDSLEVLQKFYQLFYNESEYQEYSENQMKVEYRGFNRQGHASMNNLIQKLDSFEVHLKDLRDQIVNLLNEVVKTQYKGYESLDYWFPNSLTKGRMKYYLCYQEQQNEIQKVKNLINDIEELQN